MPEWLRDSVEAGEPLTSAYLAMVCARIGIASRPGSSLPGCITWAWADAAEELRLYLRRSSC